MPSNIKTDRGEAAHQFQELTLLYNKAIQISNRNLKKRLDIIR